MGKDEVDEKSVETKKETSDSTYKPESDDLKTAYTARVESLGAEQAQRVLDYLEDKVRDTSSWSMLKDVRLSIVDGGISITRKPGEAAEGKTKPDGGGKDKSEPVGPVIRDDNLPTLPEPREGPVTGDENVPTPGGDWIDNLVDEGMVAVGLKDRPVEKKDNPDGSTVETQEIAGKDCATQIKRPNGHNTEVEYDSDGNPTKIKNSQFPDESWEKTETGWQRTKDGVPVEPQEGEQPVADIQVSPDGTVTAIYGDGSTETQNTDGSVVRRELGPDETGVMTDRITQVTHPNGDQQFIGYDDKGSPNSWASTNPPEVMVKQPDGKWLLTREDGSTDVLDTDVTVHENGDLSHRYKDGTFEEIYHPDGTAVEVHHEKDGKTHELHFDQSNELTDIKHPDGTNTHIEYAGDPPSPNKIVRPDGSEWNKEGDTWTNKKTGEVLDGDIKVDSDGVITKSDRSGKTIEEWHPNGETKRPGAPEEGEGGGDKSPNVVHDKRGRVTEIQSPDGEKTRVIYGRDGQSKEPTQIVEADQSRWIKSPDGTWNHFKNGEVIANCKDIDVDERGNIKFTIEEGRTTTRQPDGTNIGRDKDDRVTWIKHPDGRSREFRYDDGGELTEVSKSNGSTYRKESDGTWTRTDENGETNKIEDVQVDKDGNLSWKDGSVHWRDNADGTSEKIDTEEGSAVKYDSSNRPEEIKYPNDETAKIKYSESGEVEKLEVQPGNQTLEKGKDGVEDIKVSANGDIEVVYEDHKLTQHTDGSLTDTKPDNSSTTRSSDGTVINVTYPNGEERNFDYDDEGNLKALVNEKGEQILTRNEDGTWTEFVYDEESGKWDPQVRDNVDVNQEDGSLEVVAGETKTIYHPDGSTEMMGVGASNSLRFNPDGSTVARDWGSNPPVTEIKDADGNKTTVTYDGDTPVRIEKPDGTVYEKREGSWGKVGTGAADSDISDVEVKGNGDIVYTSAGGRNQRIEHAGGKESTQPVRDVATKTTPEAPEAPTEGKADRSGDEAGFVGGRFRDVGAGALEEQELKKNSRGEVAEYTLPDGRKYQVDYHDSFQKLDDNGQPVYRREVLRVIYPDADGRPHNYVKTGKGWVDLEKTGAGQKPNPDECPVDYVETLPDGSVKIVEKEYTDVAENKAYGRRTMTIKPDGSFVDEQDGFTRLKVDADGTVHKSDGTVTKLVTDETGREFRSRIAEQKSAGSDQPNYVVTDDQGHTARVDVQGDGSATYSRAGKEEKYDKVEREPDGDLKLTNKDGSLEIRQDGTTIHRNKQNQITEITNSDGETTRFTRTGKNVTEVKLFDAQGTEIKPEQSGKVTEIDDVSGTYKIALKDGHKLERKADGTERELDKDDNPVETRAEKLLSEFKHYTPEQQRQLRQDLADIDKLPKEQREKIYDSLEKIAKNDESSDKIKLTGDQARELVASLAHQVAHPESIAQGDKMTCAVACCETTIATNHPDVYADMVAKLATDGGYTAADGTVVKAQTNDGKLSPKSDAYGQRSYASELFQNAGAQLGLDPPKEYASYGPHDYAHLRPYPPGVDPSTDLGERVIDRSTDPPTVEWFPGFNANRQAKILNRLAPGDEYAPQPIADREALGEAAKNGLPILASVHLGAGDMADTGMSGSSGASGSGNHAVVITHIEYDKEGKPSKVYYENTAGGTDHSYPNGQGVDADKFVKSMHSGDAELKTVIPKNKTSGAKT